MEAEKDPLCALCTKSPAKYTCPKCAKPYCTLECYRNTALHGQCSEAFYRDQVIDSLKQERRGAQAELARDAGVLDSDKALRQALAVAPEPDADFGERFANVNVAAADCETLLGHMTASERRAFFAWCRTAVDRSGGSLLPQWTPWWELERSNGQFPAVLQSAASCEKSGEKPERAALDWLLAYVLTLRTFNGDVDTDPRGLADLLAAAVPGDSSTLTLKPDVSLAQVCAALQVSVGDGGAAAAQAMWADAQAVLQLGVACGLAPALSDAHRILARVGHPLASRVLCLVSWALPEPDGAPVAIRSDWISFQLQSLSVLSRALSALAVAT